MESGPEHKGLARVEQMCEDRSSRARELGSQGSKIMGHFCCAPVEIITAAGLIPYRITGDMQAQVTQADAHVETIACPFVRSAFDISMKGGYDFLDGFVVPHGCDSTERIYEIWNYHFKPEFSHFINIPHTTTRSSWVFAKEELRTFQRNLERLTGKKILPEGIKEAIRAYNQNRSLVRELYELRKPDPPLVSGTETMKVVLANKSLPVEEGNEMVAAVLQEIRQRPKGPEKKPVRTMIYGSELDDPVVMQVIEDAGSNLVIDDICMGSRTYLHDVEVTEDPLDGLVNYYLRDLTCPRTWGETKGTRIDELDGRFGYLLDLAKDWNANGVIHFVMRYCDNFAFDVPDVKEYLQQAGLKVLHLESDYAIAHPAQLKTRVQAFVEMLK
jgi:bcr-type benzoyl-CoA reductase subunit C